MMGSEGEEVGPRLSGEKRQAAIDLIRISTNNFSAEPAGQFGGD